MERQHPDLEDVIFRIKGQNKNRIIWEMEDDQASLEQMFDAEYEEMKECEEQFFLKPMADFHMVSEVGDVGYLFLRYTERYGMAPKRMSEKLGEAISIAARCGFRMTDAVHLKLIRNSHKYGDVHFDGTHQMREATEMSKRLWDAMGGDDAFFNYYMEEYGET